VTALEDFIISFEALDSSSMNGLDKWEAFIRRFIKIGRDENWRHSLHFDTILSLFGFEASTSKALQDSPHEGKNLTQTSLRWLSKAMGAYGPKGCFGDIVNLAYATLKIEPQEGAKHSEAEIVQVLLRLGKVLRGDMEEEEMAEALWLPTHLVHDAESDDIMVLLVLDCMHRRAGTRLQVLTQLPSESSIDQVAHHFEARIPHCSIYRDPHSGNGSAIKSHFGIVAAKSGAGFRKACQRRAARGHQVI